MYKKGMLPSATVLRYQNASISIQIVARLTTQERWTVNPLRRVVIAKNSAYFNYNQNGTLMEYQSIEAFRAIARRLGSQ